MPQIPGSCRESSLYWNGSYICNLDKKGHLYLQPWQKRSFISKIGVPNKDLKKKKIKMFFIIIFYACNLLLISFLDWDMFSVKWLVHMLSEVLQGIPVVAADCLSLKHPCILLPTASTCIWVTIPQPTPSLQPIFFYISVATVIGSSMNMWPKPVQSKYVTILLEIKSISADFITLFLISSHTWGKSSPGLSS